MAPSRVQLNTPPAHRRQAALSGLVRTVVVAWALLSLGTFAAVISLRPPTSPGELRIPVIVQGVDEETLSGVQFDVHYDPAQYTLVAVTPGAIATEAGKEVVFSETLPGQGRVLVTGFNNNALTDGQVATLVLRPLNTSATHEDIGVARFLATDPDGNSVPLDYEDLYGYAPPAPEEEPEKETSPEEVGTAESPPIDGPDVSPTPGAPTPASAPESNTSARTLGGYYPGGAADTPDAGQTGEDAHESRSFTARTRTSGSAPTQRSNPSRSSFFSGGHARTESSGLQRNGDVQSNASNPRPPSSDRQAPSRVGTPNMTQARESSSTVPPGPRLALGGPIGTPDALGTLAAPNGLEESLNTSPASYKATGVALLAPLTVLALLGIAHQLPRLRRNSHGWRKKR